MANVTYEGTSLWLWFRRIWVHQGEKHITSGRHRSRNRELRPHIFKYGHKAEGMMEKYDRAVSSKPDPNDRLPPARPCIVNLPKQTALTAAVQVTKFLSIFLFFPTPRKKDLKWYCVMLPLVIQIPQFILFFPHILLRAVNSLMLRILTKIFKVASVKSPRNLSSLQIGLQMGFK